MSNKITVTLDGRRYNLISDSDTGYMTAVADFVNEQITEVRAGMPYRSGVDCATLTALNLADELYQERVASEDIRKQLIQALDENRKLANQLKEATKEAKAPRAPRKNSRGRKAADKQIPDQVQIPLAGEYVEE